MEKGWLGEFLAVCSAEPQNTQCCDESNNNSVQNTALQNLPLRERLDKSLCKTPRQIGHPESMDTNIDVTVTLSDNSTYTGQMVDGMRHGFGMRIAPKEQYIGHWSQDLRHGDGNQNYVDGRRYEGQFLEGQFHGTARMEWVTSDGITVYNGQYINGLKHGYGVYIWKDGRTYSGEWAEGQRLGQAMCTRPSGERRFGNWPDEGLVAWFEADEN